MSKKRFEYIFDETAKGTLGFGSVKILVDKETGVNYLQTTGEGFCGLTPLLDSNGNAVVTPMYDEK